MDDASRQTALLAAVLFSIGATAIALFLRRRAVLTATAALVVITALTLHAWRARQVRPLSAEGTVTPATE